jgi:multiple sugar transport system permease protein
VTSTGVSQEFVQYRPSLMKRAFPDGWSSVLRYFLILVLVAWAALSLFPVYWAFITSFKPPEDVASLPPKVYLTTVSLHSYRDLFEGVGVASADVGLWFVNSTVTTAGTMVGILLLASLAGYAFAKKEFWGRDILFWSLIATMLIPGWATIVPQYLWTKRLDLHDTFWVLILPGLASPFAVFLVRQFMITLPTELFQAARVDGASEFGLWYRIALPLSRPVLGSLALFTLVSSWNQFLWPLLVLNKTKKYTLLVGASTIMYQFQDRGPTYGIAMAVAVLMSAVPVVTFLILQRQMVRGLTIGALKG